MEQNNKNIITAIDSFDDNGLDSYANVLRDTQEYLSQFEKDLINTVKTNRPGEEVEKENALKDAIREFIVTNNIQCDKVPDREVLTQRLFDSMVRFDFLTPYILDDAFILEHGIEEINGNAWNEIYITDKTGKHLLDESFCSPEQALTVMSSLATKLDKTLNEGTPIFLGEIKKNVRIACVSKPIVDPEKVVQFSIRIVSIKTIKRDDFIKYGTYSEDELNLLEVLVENDVSVLFAGAVNSGKTASMNYLLSYLTKDAKKRTTTIEIEAREFNLPKYDENGKAINDTISWRTRENMDGTKNIDANKLEELALRFSQQVIGIGEMRNKEAMITCEIATTGNTVITTTHSKDARSAYDRVVALCKKAQLGYDDATLYRLAVEAFPIIAFQRLYPADRKRVCTEIIEGIGYENGKVYTRTLYAFERDPNIADKTVGKHVFKNNISNELMKILIDNGVTTEQLNKIIKVDK